ncbi:MAG: ABC transporter ATP-binding protein [Nocardioides sp.]
MDGLSLTVSNVRFRYPGTGSPALDDVSLRFSPGVTAVVGVNGAGKSTLLRLLGRAIVPDHGSVELDGRNIHRSPRRLIAGRIGFMPQDFRLPAGARVLDSLTYLAWLKGVGASDAVTRSKAALASTGLDSRSADRVDSLSGGMIRRLALAQAIVARPEVLLLDEPTTGLDPQQRAAVRDLLLLPEHRARITLVSSHLMEDVATLAENIVLVHDGRVRFAGSLGEFRSHPGGRSETAESAFLRRVSGE